MSYLKVKKCVILSFMDKKDLFVLENKVYRGVEFTGSGQNVRGYRLDKLNMTALPGGADSSPKHYCITACGDIW